MQFKPFHKGPDPTLTSGETIQIWPIELDKSPFHFGRFETFNRE